MALSRDAILARRHDLPRKEVDVPGLGPVFFRVLPLSTLLKVNETYKALTETKEYHKLIPYVVRMTACDEAGNPLFTADDDEALLDMPKGMLDAMSEAAMVVNGMTPDADEGAKKN